MRQGFLNEKTYGIGNAFNVQFSILVVFYHYPSLNLNFSDPKACTRKPFICKAGQKVWGGNYSGPPKKSSKRGLRIRANNIGNHTEERMTFILQNAYNSSL